MNTPTQQAELYRKAAETIEMCAEHGIEPKVKYCGDISPLVGWGFDCNFDVYEFPITVIEGQLVWADTIVYSRFGKEMKVGIVITNHWESYTLTQPKQPLCEVEGKPVYKGDKLWNVPNNHNFVADHITTNGIWNDAGIGSRFEDASWNQPKRTVMVELTVDDAEAMKLANDISYYYGANLQSISNACKKALDNLK